jgi:hypothetical protein
MTRRRFTVAYLAVVLLTVLQPVLLYTVAGARYEFAQALGLAALAVALVRLARGSRGAWMLLAVLNAFPPVAAVMTALSADETMASGLIVLLATSVPLLVALLSPPMLGRIRHPPGEGAPPVTPLTS